MLITGIIAGVTCFAIGWFANMVWQSFVEAELERNMRTSTDILPKNMRTSTDILPEHMGDFDVGR